jgi:hypothetical protein
MTRTSISKTTIKKLFALSGNQCAFPNCPHELVDIKGNILGQICHIEAANPGGERYNPNQTDDQRAAFENLILLCGHHHIVTNDFEYYPVEVLKQMKVEHEARFQSSPYQLSDEAFLRLKNIYKELIEEIPPRTSSNNFQEFKNSGSGSQFNIGNTNIGTQAIYNHPQKEYVERVRGGIRTTYERNLVTGTITPIGIQLDY